MQLGTFYRTARRLRWSQLLWRARYQLERRRRISAPWAAQWRWRGAHPPQLRHDLPHVPFVQRPPASASQNLLLLRTGAFEHLNECKVLGETPDWKLGRQTTDRLWSMTLHYHAWAHALAEIAASGSNDAVEARKLLRRYLTDWLSRCALDAPGSRELVWNSYTIATRIGWWARTLQLLEAGSTDAWAEQLRRSLWQQAAFLHDHLEWDLRANHLLRNAVGLAWAGRFFDEPQARTWLRTAAELAVSQTREQVLPDGGHFERSPMYHLHVMEDVAVLAMLLEEPPAKRQLCATWERMADYLAWMRHPDGQIPLFNDAALNGAGAPLATLHSPLPRGGRWFSDSGMAVWHGDPWTVFFDVGPVGPDYQPGHAHADTLSIACSYRGRRLFVDPGTYGYDDDERRRRDRSTAAHNTVCIDDRDSSEVWHIFRVGRRAYPLDVAVDFKSGGMLASATHDGYDHLAGGPRHVRRVQIAGDSLVIEDRVTGGESHSVTGGLLLHPDWHAKPRPGGWSIGNGAGAVLVDVIGPPGLVLSQARCPYHPEFGREMGTTRLIWRVAGPLPVAVNVFVKGA